MSTAIKNTPLHDFHAERGARFVPFAGWQMPISYGPIMDEHKATREAVGLFDVSHMGEIEVTGVAAEEFLNYVLVNDVSRAGIGGATYSPMCQQDGGVLDDLIAYQLDKEEFLLCVNAANLVSDLSWLKDVSSDFECEVRDLSDQYGLLAVQGPRAELVLQKISEFDLTAIGRFRFVCERVGEAPVICSRTGYTGENGFELYCSASETVRLAEAIMQFGESEGICLVGLGARDSLRLEAGYPLYGHEISQEISPLQAGLAWTVKWNKNDFLGKDALLREKEEGVKRKIIHFTLDDRRIARQGEQVLFDGKPVGHVVSGGFSPILECPMGSALVNSAVSRQGLFVDLRGKQVELLVKGTPLHKS